MSLYNDELLVYIIGFCAEVSLVPSPPPQLSLLAVQITQLQATIAAVEDWERGY